MFIQQLKKFILTLFPVDFLFVLGDSAGITDSLMVQGESGFPRMDGVSKLYGR
jgi:hypothetical protein